VLLAVAALTLCYAGIVRTLADTWITNSLYSYGFATVIISAYLLWTRSDRLRDLEWHRDYILGVPVILAGVAMLVVGRLGLFTSVQEVSLLVTLSGFVLLFFGREIFGCVWFPLWYVLLGIPVWDYLIGTLQPHSQELSARIASNLLQTIGIPVLREGTSIALPNVTLEVMRECSGVNQLLAIITMTLPAAYLWLRSLTRRVALVSLAVVVAYLSNGIRIALVGFLAYHGMGAGDLRGMHLFEGLAVSASGYVVLLAVLSILSRGERNRDRAQQPHADTDSRGSIVPQFAIEYGMSLIVIAIAVSPMLFQSADIRLAADLGTFPNQIDAWRLDTTVRRSSDKFPAIEDELIRAYPTPTGEHHFADLDDELVRTYHNDAGQRLRLYIGYHRSQRDGKELVGETGHLLNVAATPLNVSFGNEEIELREVQQNLAGNSRGLFYCYVINGRVLSNLYLAKRYMVWDALTRRRTNGAVVMVAWGSGSIVDAEVSRLNAAEFMRAVLPLLPKFIPS
jgi:EpsI family protein